MVVSRLSRRQVLPWNRHESTQSLISWLCLIFSSCLLTSKNLGPNPDLKSDSSPLFAPILILLLFDPTREERYISSLSFAK